MHLFLIDTMSFSFILGVLTFTSTVYASGRLQHAFAVVGQNTVFDCIATMSAAQIVWVHKSADRTHSSVLMNGLSIKDNRSGRVRVDYNRTDFSGSRLLINNIQLTDAGTYNCVNGHTGETQLTAELTVFAKETSCHTNIASAKYIVEEDDHVLVTCNISSYGVLVPSVTCDIDSNQTRLVKAWDTLDSMLYTCYRWKVKATTAIRGLRVMCNVWFEHQQETFYNNTWTSPAISLAYGPHSVTIHPQNQTVFEDGDQLECTADGNPSPHYHWTAGNVVENGQTLTIDVCKFVAALSTRVLVKCIADRDTRTATTTKEIEIELTFNDTQWQKCSHRGVTPMNMAEPQPINLLYPVAATIIVVLVLVLVVAVVAFFICWRKRSNSHNRRLQTGPVYCDLIEQRYVELPSR